MRYIPSMPLCFINAHFYLFARWQKEAHVLHIFPNKPTTHSNLYYQTSWSLSCPPTLLSLYLSVHSPPSSFTLSNHSHLSSSSLPPSLPSSLPLSLPTCQLLLQGLLTLEFSSDKRMDRTTKKRNEWQLWTPLFSFSILSLSLSLSLSRLPSLSISLPLFCFIPEGVFMCSGVSVLSNGHSDHLVCTTPTTMARFLTQGQTWAQLGLHLQSHFHHSAQFRLHRVYYS